MTPNTYELETDPILLNINRLLDDFVDNSSSSGAKKLYEPLLNTLSSFYFSYFNMKLKELDPLTNQYVQVSSLKSAYENYCRDLLDSLGEKTSLEAYIKREQSKINEYVSATNEVNPITGMPYLAIGELANPQLYEEINSRVKYDGLKNNDCSKFNFL